jgi:hypothetical protein
MGAFPGAAIRDADIVDKVLANVTECKGAGNQAEPFVADGAAEDDSSLPPIRAAPVVLTGGTEVPLEEGTVVGEVVVAGKPVVVEGKGAVS